MSESRPGTAQPGGSGDPINPDYEDLYVKYKVSKTITFLHLYILQPKFINILPTQILFRFVESF